MKKWYTSRTIIIGGLQSLSGILILLADFLTAGDFSSSAMVLFLNGVVMIVLRLMTSEAVQ